MLKNDRTIIIELFLFLCRRVTTYFTGLFLNENCISTCFKTDAKKAYKHWMRILKKKFTCSIIVFSSKELLSRANYLSKLSKKWNPMMDTAEIKSILMNKISDRIKFVYLLKVFGYLCLMSNIISKYEPRPQYSIQSKCFEFASNCDLQLGFMMSKSITVF